MGLFSALITLPLAPLRGAAWVAQQVAEEAEHQMDDQTRLRRELLELELQHDSAVLGASEYHERADVLLGEIASRHAPGPPDSPAATRETRHG